MILSLKKGLHQEVDDYTIFPQDKSFLIKVAKFKKGFYLYNTNGEQIGQIIMHKCSATITAPDSASLTVIKNIDNTYALIDTVINDAEKKSIKIKGKQRTLSSEYMVYGNADKYSYDIYEKKIGQKMPCVTGAVINDTVDGQYYKLKITNASNILIIIMICIAIDKLNYDPESKF